MLYNPKHKFSVNSCVVGFIGGYTRRITRNYVILRNEKNAKKKSTVVNNRALRLLTNPPLAKKGGFVSSLETIRLYEKFLPIGAARPACFFSALGGCSRRHNRLYSFPSGKFCAIRGSTKRPCRRHSLAI